MPCSGVNPSGTGGANEGAGINCPDITSPSFPSLDSIVPPSSKLARRLHRLQTGAHPLERRVDVGGGVGVVDIHHLVDDHAAAEDLGLEAQHEGAVAGDVGGGEADLAAGREAGD